MKLLLSADWQTEWSNLDLCKKAATEVKELLGKHRLDGVFFLGDLKKDYNPVDTRVIKFWQRFIDELRKDDYYVGILLGNHDREGQYTDDQNWLEILARAGAEVYDEPVIARPFGNEGTLYLLPWSTNVSRLKETLTHWAKKPTSTKDVLLFHQDVKGTKYNQLGARSDAKLTVADFRSTKYLGCFGGHIHLHQRVGEKVFYVGSPFCTDWGEANQRKGYIIVDGSKFSFVESKIPGWYDPTWPAFHLPTDTEGIHIRVHCECPSTGNYGHVIEAAREKAQRQYRGATIHVVTSNTASSAVASPLKFNDPDSVKIKRYVAETVPDDLDERRLVAYLIGKLNKVTGVVRNVSGIEFLKATATNFLPFKSVECNFKNQGLVVVDAVNKDRPGSSNGGGKTSFLQLIPVALFGMTFKGQKHDKWSRRGEKRGATVSLLFRESRGRLTRVKRSRRPSTVKLVVEGTDQSSGLRSDSQTGTQGLIEQVSGYTWQTLANAVYIDPSVANAFLTGTKKERSNVLTKFQNLERFEKALALVKENSRQNSLNVTATEQQISELEFRIEHKHELIDELKSHIKKQRIFSEKVVTDAKEKYLAAKKHLANLDTSKLATWKTLLEVALKKASDKEEAVLHLKYEKSHIEQSAKAMLKLSAHSTCPTCTQPLDLDHLQKALKSSKGDLAAIITKYEDASKVYRGYRDISDSLTNKIGVLRAEQAHREAVADDRKYEWTSAENSAKQSTSILSLQAAIRKHKKGIEFCKKQVGFANKAVLSYMYMDKFYGYCLTAFSRSGIPAFLNGQLVPVLNREADYYSELFADGAIQVRFSVEDGEFDVNTLNASGGDRTEDQSTGEAAMAGLIASFAICHIAPKSNVLVLDEPGAGLDSSSIRRFARGLKEISKRFSTVYVTTHNQTLLAELGRERTITIEKKNGVSRVM